MILSENYFIVQKRLSSRISFSFKFAKYFFLDFFQKWHAVVPLFCMKGFIFSRSVFKEVIA